MISSRPRIARVRAGSSRHARRTGRELFVLLMLLVPWGAAAQAVRGHVVDSTGAPVSLAQVRVLPQGPAAITDTAGAFVLRQLAPGHYWLAIRRFGFRPDTVALTVPVPAPLMITLSQLPTRLRTVTSMALEQELPRVFQRIKEHLGSVEFGPDLRRQYGDMPLDEVLRLDFKLSRRIRGGRLCRAPAVFLDGIQLHLRDGETLSSYVDLRDIAAVEAFDSPDFVHEPFIDGVFDKYVGRCAPIVLIWTNGYKQQPWGN